MLELQAQDLKPLLKELLHDLLVQEKEMLTELIYEVMEDMALAKAIDEGNMTKNINREDIFSLLRE